MNCFVSYRDDAAIPSSYSRDSDNKIISVSD